MVDITPNDPGWITLIEDDEPITGESLCKECGRPIKDHYNERSCPELKGGI